MQRMRRGMLTLLMGVLLTGMLARPVQAQRLTVDGVEGRRAVSGVVMVKVSAAAAKQGGVAVQALGRTAGVTAMEPAFPMLRAAGKRESELQRWYRARFVGTAAPEAVARVLRKEAGVAWAEPLYAYSLERVPPVTPDDAFFNQMVHLTLINAEAAWGEVRGEDGDVVIAIVDGGTDWRHVDLEANLWTNPGEEAGNGLDDDGNGYVDDVRGWNFPAGTNDPAGLFATPQNGNHGTIVAGIAAAVTDNGEGIAGMSWNARFMPINAGCETEDSTICYGYPGIVYAVENGADIVNASWGGVGGSALAEDVVAYAEENGVLVVAAAGNSAVDNDLTPHYPSSYPTVLGVGATEKTSDRVASFSNYGARVDVFAPGVTLDATTPGDQYTTGANGTSFSSPLVAGLAALVWTRFPDYSVVQVREQIRATAASMDANNPERIGKTGRGLVDAFRAVADVDQPAIRVTGVEYLDSGLDGEINREETVTVTLELTNHLAATGAVDVVVEEANEAVVLTQQPTTIGTFPGDGATRSVTFAFEMPADAPDELTLRFIARVNGVGFSDPSMVELTANPASVANLDTGRIQTSVTSQGNIGWTGFAQAVEPESRGRGFTFDGQNYLFEGGLVVATGADRVSSSVRGLDGGGQDDEFTLAPGTTVRVFRPGDFTAEEVALTIDDSPARVPIGLAIEQQTFADTTGGDDGYVILRYLLNNTNDSRVANIHAGLFFDWDVNPDASDYARFDAERRMSIVQDAASDAGVLLATRLLTTSADLSHRSINNPQEIYDGYSDFEKWSHLSNKVQTEQLNATDVSTMTAAGPYDLDAFCTGEVAFALVAGNSQEELNRHADAAQAFWDEHLATLRAAEAPRFTAVLPDTTLEAGATPLTFTYAAETPGGCEGLRFTLQDPPANAAIDAESGRLTYYPMEVGTFTITVVASDGQFSTATNARITVNEVTSVESDTPLRFALGAPYPNPSAGSVTLPAETAGPGLVELSIYDLLGRRVRTVVRETRPAGRHVLTWDGADASGSRVASGLYLVRFTATGPDGPRTTQRSVTIVR